MHQLSKLCKRKSERDLLFMSSQFIYTSQIRDVLILFCKDRYGGIILKHLFWNSGSYKMNTISTHMSSKEYIVRQGWITIKLSVYVWKCKKDKRNTITFILLELATDILALFIFSGYNKAAHSIKHKVQMKLYFQEVFA